MRFDLTERTLGEIENGICIRSLVIYIDICDVLGIPLDEVLRHARLTSASASGPGGRGPVESSPCSPAGARLDHP
jgi:DNA-binding XRE family transcriptional regulator